MRLLLVEDEISLSDVLLTILTRDEYIVDAVYDGLSALEQLERENYDGAIMDVMMPGMDGITVLKKIREKGSTLPVLLLTARAEIEDKVLGLDSGANDYLSKPFDTRELLARIRAMLRIEEDSTAQMLNKGNIRLNCATMEMSSDTGSFRLSGREFRLMKFLMKNSDRSISEKHFMEKEGMGEGESSTVRAYILFLKRKLEALHANLRIQVEEEGDFSLEVVSSDK